MHACASTANSPRPLGVEVPQLGWDVLFENPQEKKSLDDRVTEFRAIKKAHPRGLIS